MGARTDSFAERIISYLKLAYFWFRFDWVCEKKKNSEGITLCRLWSNYSFEIRLRKGGNIFLPESHVQVQFCFHVVSSQHREKIRMIFSKGKI